MPILGVTHSETGEALQRLAVTTKVAIGEVVKGKGDTTYPKKLDHFVFLKKNATTFEWEPDNELIQHYGSTCREFWIVLLDDEIENVFSTGLAWWTKAERKCWGDGRNATRRTEKHPEGEDWTPCGDACPDLDKGLCKAGGDLHFILADFPRLGAICRLHTTSYRSIRQLHSALEQIRTVTGGRLAGIRCKLVVRPEKASYVDAKDGKKKTTTVYALNVELSADDMRKLISQMTKYATLFEQTRKLLGEGRKVEYQEEEETERAPDVAQEFYPAEDIQPAPPAQPKEVRQPERASATAPTAEPRGQSKSNGNGDVISADQRKNFYKICLEQGWGTDQVKDILRDEFSLDSSAKIPASRYGEICKRFAEPRVVDPPYEATNDDIPF